MNKEKDTRAVGLCVSAAMLTMMINFAHLWTLPRGLSDPTAWGKSVF